MNEVNLCCTALHAYLCTATQIPAQVNPATPAYGICIIPADLLLSSVYATFASTRLAMSDNVTAAEAAQA